MRNLFIIPWLYVEYPQPYLVGHQSRYINRIQMSLFDRRISPNPIVYRYFPTYSNYFSLASNPFADKRR